MREALFIKKNKHRWEQVNIHQIKDADATAKEFIELIDDVAYAKTFYPQSQLTKYINNKAAHIYLGIYKNRKEDTNRFINFWKFDVPLAIYKYKHLLILSFLIFVLFFAVGFFTSIKDHSLVRDMLGNSYVEKTEQNIAEGNPLGIYQTGNAFVSFLGIMINNIMVSLIYYMRGLCFGILTLKSLIEEAVRLGAFEQMFFSKGVGMVSVYGVLLHGLLELTAIIIACGAGLILIHNYLFPGTFKRISAVIVGAKDGITIVVGLVPVFFMAAFFEGFITRYYKMPIVLNLFLLLLSLLFIVWYFMIYPVFIYHKYYSKQTLIE